METAPDAGRLRSCRATQAHTLGVKTPCNENILMADHQSSSPERANEGG